MNHRWLLRMARWARNPPSEGRVKFVLAIVLVCVALFAWEHFMGWPEILTPDPTARRGYKP